MNSATESQALRDAQARLARRVTWVGFWCNAALGTIKTIAGILSRSGAVIADGIHSFSDFATDLIVIIMVTLGRRGPNARYEYGHGKYETLGTTLVAVALIIVGVVIFYDGLVATISAVRGADIPRPGLFALIACALSIVVKEALYRYTVKVGRRIKSEAVIANAWHHRSDAFSSVATVLGVGGAIFLGPGARILDPIAMMIVAVMITLVGVNTLRPAILELLEVSLPADRQQIIADAIDSVAGVEYFHHLRTRRNGTAVIVDVHIKVNPFIPVVEAHAIATDVERAISRAAGCETIVTTHIEPFFPDKIRNSLPR